MVRKFQVSKGAVEIPRLYRVYRDWGQGIRAFYSVPVFNLAMANLLMQNRKKPRLNLILLQPVKET